MAITKEDLVEHTNGVRDAIDILNQQKQVFMYLSSVYAGARTEDDKEALKTILSNVTKNLKEVSLKCDSIIKSVNESFYINDKEESL